MLEDIYNHTNLLTFDLLLKINWFTNLSELHINILGGGGGGALCFSTHRVK